ncbi:MAG: diaminopimelate decarboxylase [Candidatus Omnitrophica bacterium]|jgi:diaminopimelate decarboxylase|nr:diaminopimelate decarboxylase [Candidatus Omnitrophota bacterium]
MHDFRYKNGQLYCEDVRIKDLADKFGTPLYVYSYNTFTAHFLKLKKAFCDVNPLICYSVKANSNLSILKALVAKGAGLDIVSGGELFRAIKAGCPAQKIVYASVGKTDKEIEDAIKQGILFFNAESLPELENINRIAKRLNKFTNVALRINPDVEPKTHKYITTGKLTNKFGIDFDTAAGILKMADKFFYARIKGLHIHIGSQITEGDSFVAAIKKVTAFISAQRDKGLKLEYLNIGGGLGIVYNNEAPQTADQFARKVIPILKKSGLKIIMEPGRFIIGSAAALVVKTLYVKKTPLKKFVIQDGGMNDLIRPALYEAHHEIWPLAKSQAKKSKVDVVGPICESGDFFAKDRNIPEVSAGDLLAVMCSGAYGFSMASNYNSRRRPAEVLVSCKKTMLIRRRETYNDLVHNEVIASKFE